MNRQQLATRLKSITVLFAGAVMLFSCKTDLKEVNALATREGLPEMSGENMTLLYSDSARLKSKVRAPLSEKYNDEKAKYDEFPRGLEATLFDRDEQQVGSIRSNYAKKLEEEMLWELRDSVVVVNAEGKKLETDLLYWDMNKEIVYSDRYTRLTSGDQIIEGNAGFESDQQLYHPVFKNVTGQVEIQQQP